MEPSSVSSRTSEFSESTTPLESKQKITFLNSNSITHSIAASNPNASPMSTDIIGCSHIVLAHINIPNSSLKHIPLPTLFHYPLYCSAQRMKRQYYTSRSYWVAVAISPYLDEFVAVTRAAPQLCLLIHCFGTNEV
ncbi:hypothetical protein MTR_3g063350 [Medicago truncatula]|uniref:Uncharacterized protein n=1 Tax=Medicago truncatula TaxID=3880 RepID=A0A072UZK6_MEDTR|nr:hypothetical protein MTR_3g063350 [Medicago truncatula]